MKIALVQESPVIGDVQGNVRLLQAAISSAADRGADLAVCCELAITGYPPRDYLDRREFILEQRAALDSLAGACAIPTLVGFIDHREISGHLHLFNAAACIEDGRVVDIVHKTLLPTYDVFDERRYFTPGAKRKLTTLAGLRIGVSICEDIWNDKEYWSALRYDIDPLEELVAMKPDILINLSASPYSANKPATRRKLLQAQARKCKLPLVMVNQIGAHDDLVFDGGSMAFDSSGQVVARCSEFSTDCLLVDFDKDSHELSGPAGNADDLSETCETQSGLNALILGLKDYCRKCGFSSVILGLSGGIDSALTAAIASAALGPDKVYAVALPSKYSSEHSLDDAEELARNMGIHYQVISIEDTVDAIERSLAPAFADCQEDVTEENIQARARGIILMALSNKFGHLLLNTGNKSEVAVGYCTLYGDMCGGLSVLSDVFKTEVYRMSNEINRRAGRAVIPESTITKAPSAELRPGQVDQDSLPPYELLDSLLQRYIEDHESAASLYNDFDRETVDRVLQLVRRSEFKRYQLAPGIKIRSKAFGPGRRMPLAHRSRC
ncbi:MAG: NAD+ synthase [Kofleriaceae bacterium]|nr:NAD+ synthase [Kofleriaceae bacterium]